MECEKPINLIDCKQSIELHREEIFTHRQQRPYSPPKFHIDFVFTCKPFIHKWVLNSQHSPNPRFKEILDLPEINTCVYISLDKFLSQEPAREILEQRLENWPVNKDWRTSFIDYVMLKAQDKIINMPRRDNSVCLEFEVTTIHKHALDEIAAEECSIQMAMDNMSDDDVDDDYDSMSDEDSMEQVDDDCCMIPTLESSIESLETKMVMDDDTTCSICLEELFREGVSIGCSHIFHGDCIKTWLRNSHYCPVCRFEMPMAS